MIRLREFNAAVRKLAIQSADAIPTHLECPNCESELYQNPNTHETKQLHDGMWWVQLQCPECKKEYWRLDT